MTRNSTLTKQIAAAHRVGVPLVAINTPDPAATIISVCNSIKGDAPRVEWDFVRGLVGRNQSGMEWARDQRQNEFDPTVSNPPGALIVATKLPEDAILFIHLAGRWLGEPGYIQAAWNLRDAFKTDERLAVFLGKQIPLPPELTDDVLTFDEPLPNTDELKAIVEQQHRNAGLEAIPEQVERATEALRGLSAFCSEQVTAMSLTTTGMDLDSLWERKRQAIEQTPGLKVYRGDDSFGNIGGCDVIKSFLSRIMMGASRPNAIVFLDEIEKMIGGAGDTSGVSQDQLGSILSYMQDYNATGMIFLGPPGAAKSAVAKSAGNLGKIPTIQFDLGGTKGSLVGQSEQQFRQGLKVITAVSNGRSLWIATCNAIKDLPPELRRRFTLGTYFFDLPTVEERRMIWTIWLARYGLDEKQPLPGDEKWTGAEIKQCCDIAMRLGCSVTEASEFVVPVARSAPDQITALQDQANDRFLSASYPGVYQKNKSNSVHKKRAGERAIKLAE